MSLRTLLIVLCIGSMLVVLSALLPARHDGGRASHGLPFAFVHQDISQADPLVPPVWVGLVSPWENPTHVSLGTLLLDIVIIWMGCLWAFYLQRMRK